MTTVCLGAVIPVQTSSGERVGVVTAVYADGSYVVTPIPEGMTPKDLGRRFWPSVTERISPRTRRH